MGLICKLLEDCDIRAPAWLVGWASPGLRARPGPLWSGDRCGEACLRWPAVVRLLTSLSLFRSRHWKTSRVFPAAAAPSPPRSSRALESRGSPQGTGLSLSGLSAQEQVCRGRSHTVITGRGGGRRENLYLCNSDIGEVAAAITSYAFSRCFQ